MNCVPCVDNQGVNNKAVRYMPQSADKGRHITYLPVCAGHAEGWWDGADWDGKHLEYEL